MEPKIAGDTDVLLLSKIIYECLHSCVIYSYIAVHDAHNHAHITIKLAIAIAFVLSTVNKQFRLVVFREHILYKNN